MADQNRNQNRGQGQGSLHEMDDTQRTEAGPRDRQQHDDSRAGGGPERERGSMADDRGMSGEDDALAGEGVMESDVDEDKAVDEDEETSRR